jgi:uncharacterized protein YodC (DUF2158 family)
MAGKPKFKLGDIVRLKGQKLRMTIVKEPVAFVGSTEWRCAWHSGTKPQHADYPPEALELAPEDPPKK